MSTCSLTFLASFLLLTAILAVLRAPRWRKVVLVLANLGFIASFQPSLATLAATAAFLLGTWGLLALTARRPSGAIVFAGVAGAVTFLLAVKLSATDALLNIQSWVFWSNTVGLSYMVFKFIHVLVDVSQAQVPRLSFVTYVNYQLAFFTLTAGPINRYNEFEAAWNADEVSSPGLEESFDSWSQIFSGVIRMGIVAPLLGAAVEGGAEWVDASAIPPGYLRPLLQFYLFPWQIYFNFSGYTDIVRGCGQLLGFQLPENFNRPFGARNLIEFWDRWHMSLTQWLRVYFFMASYRYVAEHSRQHLRTAGYVLMGMTMLIFGLWHGFSMGYLLFGIVSGLAIVGTRMWGDVISARLGRAGYRRYLEHRGIRILAILATFHFVCFSELFFALNISDLVTLGRGILNEANATGLNPAVLMRVALFPVVASLVVLMYAHRTRAGIQVATAPVVARPARILRSYVPMVLRASLIALFFIGQSVSQTKQPVVFYRTF
jgi:D-alanyl-lipoteichoic acid acyltransferase DltB (MBOAT superfamily)